MDLPLPSLRLATHRFSGIVRIQFLLYRFLETESNTLHRSMAMPHPLWSSSCDSTCGERWHERSWSSAPGWWPLDQWYLLLFQLPQLTYRQKARKLRRRKSIFMTLKTYWKVVQIAPSRIRFPSYLNSWVNNTTMSAMTKTHVYRSIADWLAIRVWILLPARLRARYRTVRTPALAQIPIQLTVRPTAATNSTGTPYLTGDIEVVSSIVTVELSVSSRLPLTSLVLSYVDQNRSSIFAISLTVVANHFPSGMQKPVKRSLA